MTEPPSMRRYDGFLAYKQCEGATMLQSAWRRYKMFRIHKQYRGAKKIQNAWRRFDKVQRKQQYKGATRFQSAWRRYRNFHAYQQYKGATRFQSAWRRNRSYYPYQQYKGARAVQATWRRCVKVHSFKRYKGAKLFQSAWRRFHAYHAFQRYKGASKLQAAWRCFEKSHAYHQYKKAREIQAAWGGHVSFPRYQHYKASLSIQAAWRRYVKAHGFKQYKAARKIQSSLRRHCTLTLHRQYKAAQTIQSCWRGFWASLRYVLVCRRIVMFQITWRDRRQHGAATRIQARIRCSMRLLHYRRYTLAKLLQHIVRGYLQRTRYKKIMAAIQLLALWRVYRGRRAIHQQRIEKAAATTIEAMWRGYTGRISIWKVVCATKIQARIRCKFAVLHFQRVKAARTFRLLCVKRWLDKAATKIQALWRSYNAQAKFAKYVRDKLLVQTMSKAWLGRGLTARVVQRTVFDFIKINRARERDSAVIIQSAWRTYRARRWRDIIRHRALKIMQQSRRSSPRARNDKRRSTGLWSDQGDPLHDSGPRLSGPMRTNLAAMLSSICMGIEHAPPFKEDRFWRHAIADGRIT